MLVSWIKLTPGHPLRNARHQPLERGPLDKDLPHQPSPFLLLYPLQRFAEIRVFQREPGHYPSRPLAQDLPYPERPHRRLSDV